MKRIICAITVLLFSCMLWSNMDASAATSSWDTSKSYETVQENLGTVHVYLSTNGKECWIYQIDLKDGIEKVNLSGKYSNAVVTKIGYNLKAEDEDWDLTHNVFHARMDTPRHLDEYDAMTNPAILVTSIKLPNTVREISEFAFGGLVRLSSISALTGVEQIGDYAFVGCSSLKSLSFGTNIDKKDLGNNVFWGCDSLDRLIISPKHKSICSVKGIVLSKNKKQLIQVPQGKISVMIPTSVKSISASAFTGTSVNKVTVEKKNKCFSVVKKCLYNKKNGSMVCLFTDKKSYTLSKQVKIISKNACVISNNLKKVIIPHQLTLGTKWYSAFGEENDFFFTSKKTPIVKGKDVLPSLNKLHFSSKYESRYSKWVKENK